MSLPPRLAEPPTAEVAICGSFRRGREELLAAAAALIAAGCTVLSPRSLDFVDEVDGFVVAEHELGEDPVAIEAGHLRAMSAAEFVWLHAPGGYIGRSAAMELGYAHANGIRVFAQNAPGEPAFRSLVEVVASPQAALEAVSARTQDVPAGTLPALQGYYARVARDRGYDTEGATECMLLLTEEIGELARAVRKDVGLKREGGFDASLDVAPELADVQLYILHLANVLGVDLESAVVAKERHNAARHARSEYADAA